MTPKISVIIPNYNHGLYLAQRIRSVLGQTEKNLEIIVLDDCSTDNSREVIARFARQDARIRVTLNEQNSGNTFAQWNKGLAQATGEYVWIAESDDFADPRFLETLSSVLEKNPSVGLAYCNSWHVDESGRRVVVHTETGAEFKIENWQRGFTAAGQGFIEEYLCNGNVIPNASAVLLRRSITEEVGPAETNFKLAGDWIYWIRVLARCDVAFVARPLNFFRRHACNVRSTTKPLTVLLEGAKMIKRLRRHVSLGPCFEEHRARQVVRDCFHAVLYDNMRIAKVRKVLAVLRKALPNYRSVCLKEIMRILLANRFSGLRQVLGDGILYRLFRGKQKPALL
ncbi:glycosyltransferase family 2 protein [Hymenobacter pini]|uniref:glycosyltransferase family 2 protein n=1 Tax=Hymenobacter pini TaxID=2880879 RepID=UPI001CF1C95C|nr:glycosyltransferase [Hymenobacter pini]MCA8829564.1 glycosyltransferase [Hymenobacter pini]